MPGYPASDNSTGIALALIYACSQISLMLYLHPKYIPKGIIDVDSRTGLGQQSPMLSDVFRRSSAFAFCTLIDNFSLLQDLIGKELTASLASIDKVCERLGLPKYTEQLQMQLSVMQEQKLNLEQMWSFDAKEVFPVALDLESMWKGDEISPEEIEYLKQNWSLNFNSKIHVSYFVERANVAFKASEKEAGQSIFPLFFADGFPSPYILVDSKAGERRMMIKYPWQKQPTILPIPYNFLRLYYWNDMIYNKLLYDEDLACY
jgi:hypothetical protein